MILPLLRSTAVSLALALLLTACSSGNKVRLRPVSADERIERHQIPRTARIPSTSGIVPGDSDIVGSNITTQAALPPSLTTPPQQETAQAQSTTTHRVRKGETLLSIARQYGISLQNLVQHNGIANPNLLAVGQNLSIPTSGNFAASKTQHIIKKGETLYSVAKQYGVSVKSLKRTNRIKNANKLNIGQLLIVRQKTRLAQSSSTQQRTGTATRQTNTQSASQQQKTPKKLSKTPSRERKDFLRPVSGKVVSRYGEKSFGQRNNGINIAAKAGSTVKAAENGVVVYSGSALKGFGNLILVRHADGYLTAYGYNSKNLTSRGDRVKRGQKIAEVGSSGDARKAMLHFELRRNSRPVDPLKHFAKS